jgi:hypothetical protein
MLLWKTMRHYLTQRGQNPQDSVHAKHHFSKMHTSVVDECLERTVNSGATPYTAAGFDYALRQTLPGASFVAVTAPSATLSTLTLP